MKKFLLSVACLCLLAVLVPAAKLNAATLPWDGSTKVKGTVQIGSTMTVDEMKKVSYGEGGGYNWQNGIAYYRLDAVAGQSYYIAGAENDRVSVRVYKHNPYANNDYDDYALNDNLGGSERIGYRNLYATTNETWYIYLNNNENKAVSLTLLAGQTFTGTVTKNDGRGDNYYYFKPALTGTYTFEVTSSDPDADPEVKVGYIKRGQWGDLSDKNITTTRTFGKSSVSVNLQAGQQYVVYVWSGFSPYTLKLTQTPTVSVDKVIAKKAVSKKAKKAVVTWKKVKGVSGYEVTYSLKKNYKKAKTVKVSAKKGKVTLKKLKRGKTYYVKVRAFKTVEGNDYFGAYSKTMKVKIK